MKIAPVLILLNIPLVLLSLASMASYVVSPSEYQFGTEVYGFAYTSVYHYFAMQICILTFATGVMILNRTSTQLKWPIALTLCGWCLLVLS